MKKQILLLLSLIVSSITTFARDFTYTYEGQTLTYTVLDEEAKTCSTKAGTDSGLAGNNISGDLILPSNPKDGDTEFTLTEISATAFYNCINLTSVIIPNTVEKINYGAFNGCTKLTNISIPNSVTFIGNTVFYSCSNLSHLEIPNSVTSIGWAAFFYCDNLKKISFEDGDSKLVFEYSSFNTFTQIDTLYMGRNWEFAYGCILQAASVKHVIIGNKVTVIPKNAFSSKQSLISVSIGNAVDSIGDYAFANCTELPSVIIPPSVTFVSNNAFSNCAGLQKAAYPDNLTWNPFYNGLSVKYPAKDAIVEDGFVYGPGKSAIYYAPLTLSGDYAVPNTVETIGEKAFVFCKDLTSIKIPNSVKRIGTFTFYNCTGLQKSEFESIAHLCSISFETGASNPLCLTHHLFINGQEITELEIPDSVTNINAYAFNGAEFLTSVKLPNSVISIGYSAFFNCIRMNKVDFASIEDLCKIQYGDAASNPLYNAHHLYINGKEITEIELPGSISKINNFTFTGARYLTSIKIPDTITSIGDGAFGFCSGLTSIIIPNSVTSIGKNCFSYCSGLTYVKLPESVNNIGYNAFSFCNHLTSINLPNSITRIEKYTFQNCSSLSEITIPNSVTSIGEDAFAYCTSLKSVTIPNNVTTIGNAAFLGCSQLTSIAIPNLVTEIGRVAFAGCSELTSILIPNSVKEIGELAFALCPKIKSIYYKTEDPIACNKNIFEVDTIANPNCVAYENATLYLPAKTIEKAKQIEPWNLFANIAELIIPVDSIAISETALSLTVGETATLTATVFPEDATDKSITWASSDSAVATVDNDGLVTLIAEGKCIITVTTNDGTNLTAECIITGESGIDDIFADDNATYDVYNLNGIIVLKDCDKEQLKQLTPGAYIIRSGNQAKTLLMR